MKPHELRGTASIVPHTLYENITLNGPNAVLCRYRANFPFDFLQGSNEGVVSQDLTNEDLSQYDPPKKKLLKSLRTRELRRRHTIKLFTDLCVYVVLLTMVIILSFQYRNPDSYKMIKTLRRVFVYPIHNSSRVRLDQVCQKAFWYFHDTSCASILSTPSAAETSMVCHPGCLNFYL